MYKKAQTSINLSHDRARQILKEAYVKLFHKEPSDGELNFGLATAFFESGYGRAGAANWAKPGQFARWAREGLYNWGALETSIAGPEKTFAKFKSMGLHPVKKLGRDAGRPVYFYLFPSDLEAAQAFLLSWGRPDTLKAAATGSPKAVAASMKNHGYYEGFWVPPGNPQNKKIPPFKEAGSKEEAERNNIRDYAKALNRHVATVVPNNIPTTIEPESPPSDNFSIAGILNKIKNLLSQFIFASQKNNYLISIGSSSDYYSSMEYARILAQALNEYLNAKSKIHTDTNNIEIECSINGDKKIVFMAIKELSENLAEVFKYATKHISNIEPFILVNADLKSDLPLLHPKKADLYNRIFYLKSVRK